MFNFAQLNVIVGSLTVSLRDDYEGLQKCQEDFRLAEETGEPTDGIEADRVYSEAWYRETLDALHTAKEARSKLQPRVVAPTRRHFPPSR